MVIKSELAPLSKIWIPTRTETMTQETVQTKITPLIKKRISFIPAARHLAQQLVEPSLR